MADRMLNRVLFFSPVAFAGLKQRHQALAAAFAEKGSDVDYVDPLIPGGLGIKRRRIGRRMTVWGLFVPFRAARFPAAQAIVARLVLAMLIRKGMGPTGTICWIADPGLSALSDVSWRGLIYDRCDRHGSFPGQNPRVWKAHEAKLFSRASIVTASSPLLLKEAEAAGARRILLVPNAVDADWLVGRLPPKSPIPPLKIVSAGAHYEWVDFPWLAKFAQTAGVELHIAGSGRGKGFRDLLSLPGVQFHGALSHQDLRSLLETCHIGVLPFADSPLTRAVDPVKVYEYAACDLEIWAPATEAWQSHPLIGRTIGETEHLENIIKYFPGKSKLHLVRSAIPTWSNRMQTILAGYPHIFGLSLEDPGMK